MTELFVRSLGAGLLCAVLLCAPAQAQQPPDPFTLEDVKTLYRVGLKMKLRRTIAFGKRKPTTSVSLLEVIGTNPKGYKLRTTRLAESGQPGKATENEYPWAPKLVDRSGQKQTLEDVTVEVQAGRFDAKLYTQTFPREGGPPGTIQTWYATKIPGLELKTVRVTGSGNRVESELVSYQLRPERGPRRSRLPWEDDEIRKRWTVGSRMVFEAQLPGGQKITFQRLITKSDEGGFSEKDTITDDKGTVLLDREKAHPWKDWLTVLKNDPGLKIGEPVDVDAAGKSYSCRPYTIQRAGALETSFLALDVPGLTVKFVSDGPRGHAERILTQVTFDPN